MPMYTTCMHVHTYPQMQMYVCIHNVHVHTYNIFTMYNAYVYTHTHVHTWME